MIQLGHVKGNKMVDMQLSNNKLVDRGIKMIVKATGTTQENAKHLLEEHKNVRNAITHYNGKK
jgi:N-acetylmuramic acid 6-phosphate etherase